MYSVIYNFANSMILDRMHQQNVTVQALIFTRRTRASWRTSLSNSWGGA
ncbi:MAG: hypothetical protein ACLTYN_03240 [Dysosmobacter welbionis]